MRMSGYKTTLTTSRLSERGEAVGRGRYGVVFVPYALAQETIVAEVDGLRGTLAEIVEASPHRIAPHCRYFSHCAGCAVQTLAAPNYAQWKRTLIAAALRRAGLASEVMDLVDAHGQGRRRATFHTRYKEGQPATGFMQSRAHTIIEIDSCPLLAPSLANALLIARAIGETLASSQKPLDILVTATASGADVDVKGQGALDDAQRQALVRIALELDLARLSNHGEPLVTQRMPLIAMGKAVVAPPPGAFLQATRQERKFLRQESARRSP